MHKTAQHLEVVAAKNAAGVLEVLLPPLQVSAVRFAWRTSRAANVLASS